MLRDDDGPERRVEKLARINQVLIDRIDRLEESRGSAWSMFQAAVALEQEVMARTRDLERALASRRLEGAPPLEQWSLREVEKVERTARSTELVRWRRTAAGLRREFYLRDLRHAPGDVRSGGLEARG